MKKKISLHIYANKKKYLFFLLILIMGVIIGIFIYRFFSLNGASDELKAKTDLFFSDYGYKNGSQGSELITAFTDYTKTFFLMWLSGLLGVGTVAVPVFIFFKGFSLGFSVAYFIYSYGLKGFLFDMLFFSPYIIFYFPSFLFCGVCIYSFYLKGKSAITTYASNKTQMLLPYSFYIFCSYVFALLGVLFEKYIIRLILSLITPSMI